MHFDRPGECGQPEEKATKMKIALLYPPPWKIPLKGQTISATDGGPTSFTEADTFSGDFLTIPYGLMSLAAQAKKAGHEVALYNLACFPWADVELLLQRLPADLFGLSCFTSNRRGCLATAGLIKELHPQCHLVLGGPHATAMPEKILEHCPAVDSVVVGEGELTFSELIDSLEQHRELTGIAGLVHRRGGQIVREAERKRIEDLDCLVSPLEYYDSHIILTSRGCPAKCTFCNSKMMWNSKVRFHSTQYVLDQLSYSVHVRGHRFLSIKDDTFTANKNRIHEICHGILERKLNFIWSCDTRVDSLNYELLKSMRMAGCRMLSVGVESGSREILANIKKRINPQQVVEISKLAKRLGLQIRFYMMWGNRGETVETIKESLELIKLTKPHQVVYTLLSIYPGSEEFAFLKESGTVTEESFFSSDFFALKFFLGKQEDFSTISELVRPFESRRDYWRYPLSECERVVRELPNLHEGHLDLATALFEAGKLQEAEASAKKALMMAHPLPGLALNCLAAIEVCRENLDKAREYLEEARKIYPHQVVLQNQKRLQQSTASGKVSPQLTVDSSFESIWIEQQPEKPVPVSI